MKGQKTLSECDERWVQGSVAFTSWAIHLSLLAHCVFLFLRVLCRDVVCCVGAFDAGVSAAWSGCCCTTQTISLQLVEVQWLQVQWKHAFIAKVIHKVIWKRRLCGLLHLTEHIFSYINNAGHVKAFFRIDWCILFQRLWTTVLQVPPIRGVRNRFCPGLAMQKKGARLRRQDSKWTQAKRVAIRNSF